VSLEFITKYVTEWAVLVALLPISLVLTRLMIAWAPKLGLIDLPDERRLHVTPTPRAGGVAIYLSMLIGTGLLVYFGKLYGGVLTPVWLGHFLVASGILVLAGIVDDRQGMSAWIKLGAQMAASVVVYFSNPGGVGNLLGVQIPLVIDLAVHVAWTVALINAFNLIDGMDGLCGGLATISLSIIALICVATGMASGAFFAGVMIVALLGFLRYNFPPARIFLGDTGSMLLGFFIATLGAATVGRGAVVAVILLPLIVGGVPLLDVALAVWRRAARRFAVSKPGQATVKIFGADREHLHHRVLGLGLSQRQAVFVIYAMAVVVALIALLPIVVGSNMLMLSVMALAVVGLVGLRYVAPIEFIASGNGLRALIRRPRASREMVLGYFLYDVFCLIASAAIGWWLVQKAIRVPIDYADAKGPILFFTVSSILGLRLARAHSRRWTRASVHDFGEAICWYSCGVGFSFALLSATQADFSFRSLIFHLCAGCVGLVAILIPRCVGVFFHEGVLDSMHRKRRTNYKRSTHTTLIYGAGDLGELFICHVRLSQPHIWGNDHFIGFIDDCEALSGRWMRGFRIMGTLEELPLLKKKHGITKVLVTSSVLSMEREHELKRLTTELGLQLEFWCPDLKVSPEPGVNAPTRRPDSKSHLDLEIASGEKKVSSV